MKLDPDCPSELCMPAFVVRRARSIFGWRLTKAARYLLLAAVSWFGMDSVADAETVIFKEDFQNRPGSTPVIKLNAYANTFDGTLVTYRADAEWLRDCNGWIARWNQPTSDPAQVSDCGGAGPWNAIQQLAQALGQVDGQSKERAKDNFAVSAYTTNINPGANRIEFESSQIPMAVPSGTGRFVTFRVDVAAINCFASPPLLQFYLLTPGGEEIPVGSLINGCATSRLVPADAIGSQGARSANADRYNAAGSLLYTDATLAVRMRNANGSNGGNDHAFDNIQIVDVSPSLSKRFQSPALTHQPIPLTLTINNTDDRLQKDGWAFTDTLDGLTVASPNNLSTTCTGSTISASEGGRVITVSHGILPAGVASCDITLDVVAETTGSYTNGTANLSGIVAINIGDASAKVDVVSNRLTLSKLTYSGTGSFAIAGNNGIAAHDLVTTTMGSPADGATQVLDGTSGTVDTVLREALPEGWRLFGVTCTGLDGGAAPRYTADGSITLPAAGMPVQPGGRDVRCTLENRLTTDLGIVKQNETPSGGTVVRGQPTTYTLTVTNHGLGTSISPVVRDTPGGGLDCPVTRPVSCSGPTGACPAGAITTGDLTSAAGVTLGTLAGGAAVALQVQCTVR
jgi:hypothetical protein